MNAIVRFESDGLDAAGILPAGIETSFIADVTLAPTSPPHANCCTQVDSPSFVTELQTAGGLDVSSGPYLCSV